MESKMDLQEDVNNLTNLFHSTLISISNEVKEIRHLTSLSKILHPPTSESISTAQRLNQQNTENLDPNIHRNVPSTSQDDPAVQFTNTILNQLQFLSDKITQMESKAQTIQQVIEEEKQALDMMKKIRTAALNQKAAIESVWSELDGQNIRNSLPGLELFRSGYRISTIKKEEPEEVNHIDGSISQNDSGIHRNFSLVRESSSSKSAISYAARQSIAPTTHDTLESDWISLEPISQSEYQSISKTILGRISLMDLNAALIEIHQILIKKYKLFHPPTKHPNRSYASKDRYAHTTDNEIYQDGLPFVTEEELRKECAFFVLEATARGILRVLRSIHRIKHVSCRQLQIRYVWLNCGWSNDDLIENNLQVESQKDWKPKRTVVSQGAILEESDHR